MSTRYKFIDKEAVYFTTSTVVGWCDVFTRDCYKKILLDSLRHCQQSQGLQLHAWAPMAIGVTNHLHTICSCRAGRDLGDIWRNSKSFTAMKIIDAIIKNPKESRKVHLLQCFETEGKRVAVISSTNFGSMRIIQCCSTQQKCIIKNCTTFIKILLQQGL